MKPSKSSKGVVPQHRFIDEKSQAQVNQLHPKVGAGEELGDSNRDECAEGSVPHTRVRVAIYERENSFLCQCAEDEAVRLTSPRVLITLYTPSLDLPQAGLCPHPKILYDEVL